MSGYVYRGTGRDELDTDNVHGFTPAQEKALARMENEYTGVLASASMVLYGSELAPLSDEVKEMLAQRLLDSPVAPFLGERGERAGACMRGCCWAPQGVCYYGRRCNCHTTVTDELEAYQGREGEALEGSEYLGTDTDGTSVDFEDLMRA